MVDVSILPFETVADFYNEYTDHCAGIGMQPQTIASLRTFEREYTKLKLNVRMLRCKGSFPTCEVCNNANDLLRNAGDFIVVCVHVCACGMLYCV
jgi:hypothetical protein